METDLSIRDRIAGAGVAGASVLGAGALLGLSLVAGLFLLIPLLFVAVLVRTAARHYFGRAEIPEEERM